MRKLRNLIASLLLLAVTPAFSQVLYKVEGNGLSEPSYIFGTHHLAPLSMIETFGASKPFEGAQQVVGEIDLTVNQMQLAAAMQPFMEAPADSTLSKLLSPEEYSLVSEQFKKWSPMPGMELAMFDTYKPAVVTTMVAVGMAANIMPDYNPTEQLDTYFQQQGKQQGKIITPLETVEEQAQLLYCSNPIAYQAESLLDMLKDPEKAIQTTQDLTEAYTTGDLPKMLEISSQDSEHPEFMKALLDERNANWLTKLPEIMKQAPAFIAVGALHLAGPQGIVEGLRNLGYTVTP